MEQSGQAAGNSGAELIAATHQYLVDNYGRAPFALARGEGSYVYDVEGRRYLDLFCGFGAGGIAGHCDPFIAAAVKQQMDTLTAHGNLFTSAPQVNLAAKLIAHSMPGKLFFCHSGAEANEAALKLVRRAAGPGRYKIISFENCFHGRTMGALSLTPPSFQESFEPMLPGNIFMPWGDLDRLKQLLAADKEIAGVFIEPLQGEGGVNAPDQTFMRELRALCDLHKILLVSDEVWTAPARTGKWFGYQHFDIQPDVVSLGKAVGGGLPLAGCIIAERWTGVLTAGTHGCTLGGNPLCCAAGLAAVTLIEERNLCEAACHLEQVARDALASLEACPVKGRGAMLGLTLPGAISPRDIMERCRAEGLLVGSAKQNVLRLAPALNIDPALWKDGLARLRRIIESALG